LEIAFADKSLRLICESGRRAAKKFGEEAAEALKVCLADMEAVDHVSELPLKVPDLNQSLRFSIPLTNGLNIVFECNHPVVPRKKGGATVDWKKVSRVKVVSIDA